MATIQLTRGYSALVDDDDYPALSKYRWHVWIGVNGHAYASRTRRKSDGPTGSVEIAMHRAIMNAAPNEVVDHIRLFAAEKVIDNRRHNLRIATSTQNRQNRQKYTKAHSIFKGVTWNYGPNRPWSARIGKGGFYLGSFRNEGHAAMMVDIAAVKRFGKFALTNFPVPGSESWLFGDPQ